LGLPFRERTMRKGRAFCGNLFLPAERREKKDLRFNHSRGLSQTDELNPIGGVCLRQGRSGLSELSRIFMREASSDGPPGPTCR